MPDLGLIRGLITLITLGTFAGICWWAYRSGNRERFEDDAWLVFDDDDSMDDFLTASPVRESKAATGGAHDE